MTSTIFTDNVTPVPASWLNDVNGATYTATPAAPLASTIHASTSKTTPVDADEIPVADSAASFGLKKLTWANLKTILGSTFAALAGSASQAFSASTLTVATDAVVPSLNGGQLAGFRNRIINGGFKVDQRNVYAAQTITAAAALAYTADRWYAYCTGANVTGQVVAGSNQTQKRYQFTGAASVTGIGFGTRLEAKDTYDMNSKTVTIGVDLANSLLTSVTWTLYRATTSDDTFGTLASPTVTQIATGTFTVNSTVTRYSTQVSVTAASTTGLQLVLSVGAQTSGTWTIGDVQLEVGSVATPFEQRPYGTELALCQRYLPCFLGTATNQPVGNGYVNTATNIGAFYTFKVQPRVLPTGVTVSDATKFTFAWGNNASSAITTATLTHSSASLEQGWLSGTIAGGTANAGGFLLANANGAQIFWTGCEL